MILIMRGASRGYHKSDSLIMLFLDVPLDERQRKMKRRAFAFLTLYPHPSAVSLDYLVGDIEANTQPRIGFFFGVSDLVEPLKNLALLLFGNPDPKILDAHKGLVLVVRDTYQHRVCLGRVLDRIIQEVNQHLPNAVSIPTHLGPDLPLK